MATDNAASATLETTASVFMVGLEVFMVFLWLVWLGYGFGFGAKSVRDFCSFSSTWVWPFPACSGPRTPGRCVAAIRVRRCAGSVRHSTTRARIEVQTCPSNVDR